MLEKLVAGRYITLPGFDQSPPPPDPTFPANFARVMGRTYSIEESTMSGPFYNRQRISQINAGAHTTKTHRTFRWLPWVLGKVSCVPLTGSDVLTGLMTGCWLVIFQFNGARYAGHIGTDTSTTSPNSVQAKAAWRNAVNANQIVPVSAFNPVGPSLPTNLNLRGDSAEFYGAFTSNGTVYTVVLAKPHAGGLKRRIARVVRMTTTQDVTAF